MLVYGIVLSVGQLEYSLCDRNKHVIMSSLRFAEVFCGAALFLKGWILK